MTPIDLLERLKSEGVSVSIKLKAEGATQPSPEALQMLKRYRDDLIVHLTKAYGDTPQMCRLSERQVEGATWCRQCYRYQQRPCVPSEKRFRAPN